MTIQGLDLFQHIPSLIVIIVNYLIIGLIFYLVYKRREMKPKLWKALVVMYIGTFAFNINFNFYETIINIPVLPLGVWFIYLISRRKNWKNRWKMYRGFAWKGFFLSFLFILTSLVIHPLDTIMYPKDELRTFISDIQEPKVITTNSPMHSVKLLDKELLNSLNSFKSSEIWNEKWYNETYLGEPDTKPMERFPYLLIGIKPKIGSDLGSMVYIERDGKGLLISTRGRQYYFRSEKNIISPVKGGNNLEYK